MIIKSMSRKSRSFSQLFHYMKNGSSKNSAYDFFSKNLYSNNDKDIVKEFLKNSHYLRSRANGNFLFHEVISITKSKQLTLKQEKERLFEIVRYYTEKRCDNNLVIGFLHDEKTNNVHYHLMISSNEIDCHKNQRLTKFDFSKVKKETEKYVIEKHPELEQDIIINAKIEQRKAHQSNKAWELKRKGGRQVKKDWMITTLSKAFLSSYSKDDFLNQLAKQNIEMYNRGKIIGFINQQDSKKYRLKTLGLENEFKKVEAMICMDNTKQREKTNKPNEQSQSNMKAETSQRKENWREEEIQRRKNMLNMKKTGDKKVKEEREK